MSWQISFCCYLLTLAALTLAHNHFPNSFSFEIDQCKDICSDSFFLLPLNKDSQTICQRGCRFFNIIDIKEDRNVNYTNEECHISCSESYINHIEKSSCVIGCDTMSKKKQTDFQKFLPYFDQYTTDEQELDSLEADILLDPLIRKQLQIGYDLQYKIPEAYIRTMPIDENDNLMNEEVTKRPFKYQLICSKMMPIIIFVIFALIIVLFVLKIIISAKTFKDGLNFMFDEEYAKLDNDDECLDKTDEDCVKEKSDPIEIHTKEIPV